ncbi:MAG: DNA polymerase I, partial [Clostridia bacterium]|nr:DNA polymerase I [Clostridia bacterium]
AAYKAYPKQLGEALFEKMGIPSKKKTKSGYSTSADVLEGLADDYPVVADILEYRTYTKLKSTYCDGLIKAIAPDGRIHSTLNQTETRTGRISSTEPNLQNIPVRSELGKEMRRFFRAKEGCVLLDADYSQIELRVLAHTANDANMIKAFNDGTDIHTVTASQVFNMPVEMVTPLMRSRAKAVNFGIVYGIGAFSLAKDIGVSRAEADSYIKGYLANFGGVAKYMNDIVEKAKKDGYVETMFMRRRYLPELSSSNHMLRAFGERVALNMPIQGTAADIIKIAMVRVYERLKKQCLKSKLIMQVHDELIIEAPLDEADEAAKILKEEMENAVNMRVKLEADVGRGKTWYDAKG